MPRQRTSLKKPRKLAYRRQNGKCCYCHQPIWLENPDQYAQRYGLTSGKTREMQCTGEHLVAHKDGGSDGTKNIAAACAYCNSHRHKQKKPLDPEGFRKFVRGRLKKGRWHGLALA